MTAPLDVAAVLATLRKALNANEHDNPADTHLYDAIALLEPHVPQPPDPLQGVRDYVDSLRGTNHWHTVKFVAERYEKAVAAERARARREP